MINSTTTGCRFKHFTPEMRGRLEQMYQEGTYSQVQMAEILGVSQSVVSRMVKCGRVRQKDYNSKYYTLISLKSVLVFIKKIELIAALKASTALVSISLVNLKKLC